jgi:hypothetical protein
MDCNGAPPVLTVHSDASSSAWKDAARKSTEGREAVTEGRRQSGGAGASGEKEGAWASGARRAAVGAVGTTAAAVMCAGVCVIMCKSRSRGPLGQTGMLATLVDTVSETSKVVASPLCSRARRQLVFVSRRCLARSLPLPSHACRHTCCATRSLRIHDQELALLACSAVCCHAATARLAGLAPHTLSRQRQARSPNLLARLGPCVHLALWLRL